MAERRNRDQMVIATKYTIGIKNIDPEVTIKVRAGYLSLLVPRRM